MRRLSCGFHKEAQAVAVAQIRVHEPLHLTVAYLTSYHGLVQLRCAGVLPITDSIARVGRSNKVSALGLD